MTVGLSLRLAIDAHHLLPRRVRHAGEDARLGDGGVALVLQNAAHRNMLVAESLEQQAAGLVVADDADRQHVDAQVGEIIDGIGSAAGHDAAFAMLENQHRSLARNARDFAENKFVGHQVAEHGDGDLGERFDDLS